MPTDRLPSTSSAMTILVGAKGSDDQPAGRAIHALRWWIGAALFASTIINYIDRQTLSLLAPYLKVDYHWSNTDYAYW